jgi:molecular chaperone Hsp33
MTTTTPDGDGCDADTLSRFVFEGAAIRGARVRLAATSQAILAAHAYPAPLARVIGELLAASALLASTLKFDGSLIVQLQGSGPVRLLVVECSQSQRLRATAQWDAAAVAALPEAATLAQLAGGARHARLVITLDPKGAGTLYQGIVALEAASVAALIEHYLATSEQLPSRLAISGSDAEFAGILLQRMPGVQGADDDTWQRAVRRLGVASGMDIIAAASSNAGLMALFPGEDLRVFRPVEPKFSCSCSAERVENALRIAGEAEIEAALAERGEVEVTCEFCNRRYVYAADAARRLFARERSSASPPTRH